MRGFKPTTSAADMLAGIKMLYTMRKGQARLAFNRPSLTEHFTILAD
jgi:hypothetical protein